MLLRPGQPVIAEPSRRVLGGQWCKAPQRCASLDAEGVPTYLGKTAAGPIPSSWFYADHSRLWQYNLHYFDDLNAHAAGERLAVHQALVQRWIIENPPVDGTGWEPYPTSLRIVNWIKWSLQNEVEVEGFAASVALQAAWLAKNIEWHLLGNHLLANGKALVFAGLYFSGPDAERWLSTGWSILSAELCEQLLEDGGHFELSPMYHSIILEDVLDVLNAANTWPGTLQREATDQLRDSAKKMLGWLSCMCHPDGEIALFNDSAFGISPRPELLYDYAASLGITHPAPTPSEDLQFRFLQSSGYVRVFDCDATLFADVGSIGPDYLPAHAHADTLSFELSLFSQRCIVDAGVSTYDATPDRQFERGTLAHNTIAVEGQNSSEVWASFRVARRARVRQVAVHRNYGAVTITAEHDGYMRLPGRVIHKRTWSLYEQCLTIRDTLSGEWTDAQGSFLLHPRVRVEQDGEIMICHFGAAQLRIEVTGADVSVADAVWSPEFGVSIATHRIIYQLQEREVTSRLSWAVN